MAETKDPTVQEDEDGGDDDDTDCCYPQPSSSDAAEEEAYRYVRYENAERALFPNDDDDDDNDNAAIPVGALVWVLLSKGKKKVPKIHKRARVVLPPEPGDEEERVLVRYPNESTYRVRRKNLVPVFEDDAKRTILVASETNDYRRMSIVHTRGEDHFIEIGCDFGILVDSVDAKSGLGIDKSEESIRIANERYPGQRFLLADVFEDDLGIAVERPLVVSIDINGNRELPAVLKCIRFVLDAWSPRMVFVKSRELHARMVQDGHE